MATDMYRPEDFGKKEVALMKKFVLQRDDAKQYFEAVIKPRLDRSYKLYIADNTDRAKEIKRWQANIAVPYVHGVVETLKPRILDARPDFTVQGRNPDDQPKASRLQSLADYTWEKAEADKTSELLTGSALVYGTGYLQVSWKRDVREYSFLSTKQIDKKKLSWVKKKQVFYDAPFVEWVDNYTLWYDWHNIPGESKQYWFKRLILTGAEIKRKYPMADKKRLKLALVKPGGDLKDYGSVRSEVKIEHERITKGDDYAKSGSGLTNNIYENTEDQDLKMYEVFEWWRPFDDRYSVISNDVPILKGAEIPNPYNFKNHPFIDVPYLRVPGEFEGYGIPLILENPQIMLNMIKNQRLDATTLNIHKMWIVNPLANIKKDELVTRPFGIVYSTDPNGAREIQFGDIKGSAYKEEELLKSDMRYGSGVDDFSTGAGGQAGSATEVRHLRESTLERVRLFVNHLGDGYAKMMRYWISMYSQFFTKEMIIRIVGEDGAEAFPIIAKDDLLGDFDFKATVIPAIAGQNDVKKKQDMDLFQLLIELPFIDPQKLTSKVLHDWNWDLQSIEKKEEEQPVGPEGLPVGPDGQPVGPDGLPIPAQGPVPPPVSGGQISADTGAAALAMLGGQSSQGPGANPFSQLSSPVNLLNTTGPPPTPRGIPAGGGKGGPNTRGLNRTGKVDTNVATKGTSSPESSLMNRAFNIQR